MQSISLAQVEHLLKEKSFDVDIEKFIEFLKLVKYKWIYPDAVQRFLQTDIVKVYELLDFLMDNGYVEQSLEIYCPNCNRYVGQHYKTIFELPEVVNCPHCDYEIMEVTQNAIIIYRVIKDV